MLIIVCEGKLHYTRLSLCSLVNPTVNSELHFRDIEMAGPSAQWTGSCQPTRVRPPSIIQQCDTVTPLSGAGMLNPGVFQPKQKDRVEIAHIDQMFSYVKQIKVCRPWLLTRTFRAARDTYVVGHYSLCHYRCVPFKCLSSQFCQTEWKKKKVTVVK